MTTTVSALRRTFKIGSAIVDDPAPSLSLEQVQQLLSTTYPAVRWTTVYDTDGCLVGDTLQYEFVLPPVKVNG